MTDCDEDREAPAASIDGLRATFESLGDAFREEAEQNVEERADGEPTGVQDERGHAERLDPFFPETILLAPHDSGDERRPLDRRSDGLGADVPPMYSDSVDVQVDAVQPGADHTVECTVRNLGGKPARHVRVELYAEHYDLDARLDTNGGVFELPKYGTEGGSISGVTTVAPTSPVMAVAVMDDEPPYEQILDYTTEIEVGDDRTFAGTLGPKPDEFYRGDPVPDDRDDFTLELWEVTVPVLAQFLAGPGTDLVPVFSMPETSNARHLASVEGQYVDPPSNSDRADQFLSGSVERASRIGRQTTSITAGDSTSLTFHYQPTSSELPEVPEGIEDYVDITGDLPDEFGPGVGRTVTAFYVRAYSLAASELPDDWNALDHTKSRFVGRTELPRDS